MSRTLKSWIKQWLVPPGWNDVLHSCSLRWRSCTTPGIVKYKNIHSGERCFILATGPSIAQMDLSVLAGEKCFAVSLFGYHPAIDVIRPLYQIAAPLHPPITEAKGLQYLKMFQERYTWGKVVCFLGDNDYDYSFRNLLMRHFELCPEEYYFIDYRRSPGVNEYNISSAALWDPMRRPFAPMTVAQEAIMLAVYMGFSKIYLLGCDYNYMRDLAGKTNQHFYDDSKTMGGRENLLEGKHPLETFFASSARLWLQYRLLYEFLSSRNVMIYNCSPDSSLDMFPKVNFSSVFK